MQYKNKLLIIIKQLNELITFNLIVFILFKNEIGRMVIMFFFLSKQSSQTYFYSFFLYCSCYQFDYI